MSKPTIPEVLERFAAYQRKELAWGCLHIVLDDGNVDNASVAFCIKYAERSEDPDPEAAKLGRILARMSKSQRLRLPRKVAEFNRVPMRYGRPSGTSTVTEIDEETVQLRARGCNWS